MVSRNFDTRLQSSLEPIPRGHDAGYSCSILTVIQLQVLGSCGYISEDLSLLCVANRVQSRLTQRCTILSLGLNTGVRVGIQDWTVKNMLGYHDTEGHR